MKSFKIIILFTVMTIWTNLYSGETKFKYSIIMNGITIGETSITTTINSKYITNVIETNINSTGIKSYSKETIIETDKYKPVKLELLTKMDTKNFKQNKKLNALFSGKIIYIDYGDYKTSVNIKKPFILPGNYFLDTLKKKKFKKGTIITANIYDPTIETDRTIKFHAEIKGYKNIIINKKTEKLIHLIFKMENIKNIDYYITEEGIMRKGIISMMNNRFELLIKE